MVVVDQFSLKAQHVGFALPADAAAAQVGGADAYRLDGLEQAPPGGHVHRQIGTRQVDVEGVADRGRGELLVVNVAIGPAARPGGPQV